MNPQSLLYVPTRLLTLSVEPLQSTHAERDERRAGLAAVMVILALAVLGGVFFI